MVNHKSFKLTDGGSDHTFSRTVPLDREIKVGNMSASEEMVIFLPLIVQRFSPNLCWPLRDNFYLPEILKFYAIEFVIMAL